MIDKHNIKRVRKVLSANGGAQLFPSGSTYQKPTAKFTRVVDGKTLYSPDGRTWYTDSNLTAITRTPEIHVPQEEITQMEVPGDPKLTPQTAVRNSAKVNKQTQNAITQKQIAAKANTTKFKPQPVPEVGAQLNAPSILPKEPQITPLQASDLDFQGMSEISAGMNLQRQQEFDKKMKTANAINQAGSVMTSAFSAVGAAAKANQAATDSNTTKTVDGVYDGVAQGLQKAGGIAGIVGTAMQFAGTAGDIIQELGGGTDQQTKTDQWMDSAFFSWNIGMLNGFAGKNTRDFGVDQDTLAQVGSSYGGTAADIQDAAKKAGKKYGLFSSKARKKANAAIDEAERKQNLMADVADTANDQRLAVQSMGEQAGLAYSMMTSGGYDQKFTYAAKQGGMLEWNPVASLEWEPQVELNWELQTFKEGGNIELVEELEWVPELKSGNTINLDEVRNYYKDYDLSNIEFITDDSPRTEGNKLYIRNDEDAVHELWHYLSQNRPSEIYKEFYDNLDDNRIVELGGDLQFVKRMENDPGHFYHPSELEARIKAAKFKTKGQNYTKEFFQNLRKEEDKYGNNMRDLLHMYNDDNLVKIFSLKKGGNLRSIEELIEYAKQQNPRFIQRLSEEPRGIKFTDDEGKEAEGSHYLESRGEYVIPRIQEVNGELQFFNSQDALNQAIETGNYLKLSPEEAIIFAEQYKQGWPDFFKKFKTGGSVGDSDVPETEETTQKNVIPEGALHKNKHHMEHAEGLTKKGIPVIDDDGAQQAEIEHSEIIFTLEVTKKLEEYYKIFYSDDSTKKEKEQAALDAGKLLVYQILENTEDRTGLIDSCKKGGAITLKKTTDDLIEEALEWVPTVIVVEEETVEKSPKKPEKVSEKEQMKKVLKEILIELLTD